MDCKWKREDGGNRVNRSLLRYYEEPLRVSVGPSRLNGEFKGEQMMMLYERAKREVLLDDENYNQVWNLINSPIINSEQCLTGSCNGLNKAILYLRIKNMRWNCWIEAVKSKDRDKMVNSRSWGEAAFWCKCRVVNKMQKCKRPKQTTEADNHHALQVVGSLCWKYCAHSERLLLTFLKG